MEEAEASEAVEVVDKNYTYNDVKYPIKIIKKSNKNTYIRVNEDLEIIVTTNYLVTQNSIMNLINNSTSAIDKMLYQRIRKNSKKESINDNNIILFGTNYKIVYGDLFNKVDIVNNNIYLKDKKVLNKYLNEIVKSTFEIYLNKWFNIFEENLPTPNLKIRKMKTRWGVCNRKNNNITLNIELVNYNINCLEYVIVHELAHFIHPNHSVYFWQLVNKYYPDYKNVRKILKY